MADRRAKIAELDAWLAGVHKHIEKDNEYVDHSTLLSPTDATGAPITKSSLDETVYEPDEIPPPPPAESYGVEALKKQQEHDEDRRLRLGRQSYQQKLREAKEAQRQQDLARKKELAERTEVERTIRGVGAFGLSALEMSKGVFKRTRSKLEGVPTPGDIWVPLALLLFFFLVLFPVNGHTRLMWLWMTITNNARIGGALPPPVFNPVTPQVAPTATAPGVLQQLSSFSIPGGVPTTPPAPGHVPGHGPVPLGPPASGGGPSNGTYKTKGYSQYGSLLQGLE